MINNLGTIAAHAGWFGDDPIQPAPCQWGDIVPGHACYCSNEDPEAPRKCPIWKWQDEWNTDNCELFEPRMSIPSEHSPEQS